MGWLSDAWDDITGAVEDVFETFVLDPVKELTGYNDAKEAEAEAKAERNRLQQERERAEKKRKEAVAKKRKEMTARVREQASRLGHSGNVVGGGLLSERNEMNPFSIY